jgi:hypothetical protein
MLNAEVSIYTVCVILVLRIERNRWQEPPMSADHERPNDVSPPQEPAATPLISAADLRLSDYPIVHVPENRCYALKEAARKLADQWSGSPDNHFIGLIGEYGWAKPLEKVQSIDTEVYPDGGDGGTDLNHRGATIDVKTVGQHRSDPSLTVDAYKPLNADYYALASQISKTDVRLIGYAPRKFVANAPVRQHEGDPYHIVEQRYLFPFPSALH